MMNAALLLASTVGFAGPALRAALPVPQHRGAYRAVLPQHRGAVPPQHRGAVLMRWPPSRFEDGEDKRLSQGGSGGGIGKPNPSSFGAYTNTESARYGSYKGQQIRKAKLEAYIYNDLEPADPMFGKVSHHLALHTLSSAPMPHRFSRIAPTGQIIAGSLLFTIFAGLFGIYMYYGGDGIVAATQRM